LDPTALYNYVIVVLVVLIMYTVLPYDGPLLCGFNVAIKGLKNMGVPVGSLVILRRVQKCHIQQKHILI